MFPAETCNEIGAWLDDYGDFANFAVALGVKWDPATQAQRMVRKYGRNFLDHVPIADELADWDTGPTRNSRGYFTLSTKQVDFYRFLIRRMPQTVERHLSQCFEGRLDWCAVEPFLGLGYRLGVPVELKTDWIDEAIEYRPAVVELLLENGILGDHNLHLDTLENFYIDPSYHFALITRMIRWGIPADLDALLVEVVDDTTQQYELIERDRINNRFDPRTQFQYQCLIQQLLNLGANPNVVTRIPTNPRVISVLMLHGANPDVAGWSRRYETGVWGSEQHIVKTWAYYGWLPPVQHAGWFFNCLVDWGCWGEVDVFLHHFGQNLANVAGPCLRKLIDARKMDLAVRMVTMFPDTVDQFIFREIVEWYVESDWAPDLDLIQRAASTGCWVDVGSILLCIKGNQRDIVRTVLLSGSHALHPLDLEDGPEWALKLALVSKDRFGY